MIPNTCPNLSNIVHTDFESDRVIQTVGAADPGITSKCTALGLQNARLERENADRKIEIEIERERQQIRDEMSQEMQQELKCERDARVNDLKELCMKSQDRQRDSDVEEFELRSSGLPISDPTVDLLAELAGIIPLSKKLKKTQNGIQTVATATDFFEHAVKSQSLQKIFAETDIGSLRFVLNRFGNALVSMKQCGTAEKLICTLLAVEKNYPDLKDKLIAGITMAAAVRHEVRLEQIGIVAGNGRSIGMNSTVMQQSLEELPGISELILSNWDAEFVKSFGDLVLSYVCFEPDVAGKMESAKQKWKEVSGTATTDCEVYVAAEKKAYDASCSWLGRPVALDNDRFALLLEKSPDAVKKAYVQYLSSPENNVTEQSILYMSFPAMTAVFQTVWDMAKVSDSVSNRLNLQQSSNQSQSWAAATAEPRRQQYIPSLARPTAAAQQQSQTQQQSQSQDSQLTDMDLQCRVCSKAFVFTVQQQEKNKERGYNNCPTKCMEHRTPGRCDNFDAKGSCDFGDNCRFQHIASDGTVLNPTISQGNTQSSRPAFRDLLPGSVKRYCAHNENGSCHLKDKCPYQHKGREVVQEELAVKMLAEKHSASSSASGTVPSFGRSGLSCPP